MEVDGSEDEFDLLLPDINTGAADADDQDESDTEDVVTPLFHGEADVEEAFDLVASLFDREFNLSIDREGTLGDHWNEEFKDKQAAIEKEVNEVKMTISELCQDEEDRRKWRMNTQKMHLMGGLSRRLGRKYSNAFCKFFQILTRFPELIKREGTTEGTAQSEPFYSLHLCEVPGNFLSAIDHFIALFHPKMKWKWAANSLNPHYEYTKASDMFLDDHLIVDFQDRWVFGDDNSGDVKKLPKNLRKSDNPNIVQGFDLVTADGSNYSLDHPERQESMVFDILIGEVECALASLKEGGSFVMKVYSSFSMDTCRLFGLLIRQFKKVVLYKPPSSKSGNTERYLICTGWSSAKSKSMINENIKLPMRHGHITKKECERYLACSRFFSTLQIKSMESNIELFTSSSLSTMEVNILADRAIERVMKECQMNILKDKNINTALFRNIKSRPWKELFKDNHVERLKELEDPVTAEQFLRDRQVAWSMADDGEMLEDAETEVEWSENEMKQFYDEKHQIFARWRSSSPLVHSIFVDPELWVALRSIHPETIVDMCNDEIHLDDNAYDQMIGSIPKDERGFHQLSVDMVPSHIDWIKLLEYVHSELGNMKGVTLLFSSRHSSSTPLILSRFSASVISMLSVLFYRVKIPHPKRDAPFIIEFDQPNYADEVESVGWYLDKLMKKMKYTLSFVPLRFMAELYPLISFYNNEMIKRVICEKLKAM